MPSLWILKNLLTYWRSILGWIVWCSGDRLFGPGSQCDAHKTEPSLHIQVFVCHVLMWFVTNFPAVRSSYSSKQCKLLIITCGKNSISDCNNSFHVIEATQTSTFETIYLAIKKEVDKTEFQSWIGKDGQGITYFKTKNIHAYKYIHKKHLKREYISNCQLWGTS